MNFHTPQGEAELAEFIAAAQDAVSIRGGGTRGIVGAGTVLSTAAMTGVVLYEPGALTMVAQAGTPVAEIKAQLAAQNQQLAFEPGDYRALLGTDGTPTIGSVFAANISGSRRIQAGAARDFLLGVRLVDGRGSVIKNGGRVMKNVTGYDLVKLMAGAHGTLGVLSEVSFKVLPQPETTTTLVISGCDLPNAIAAMSAALGSAFDVTGAAYDPAQDAVFLRLEGFQASVAYRADRLATDLSRFGRCEVREGSADLWQGLSDVRPLVGAPGDLWRISVKPSDAVAVVKNIAPDRFLLDWGGGLIWARVPAGSDVRAALAVLGHATRMSGEPMDMPRFHPEPAPIAALTAGLRAQFDPRGILNPGVMG